MQKPSKEETRIKNDKAFIKQTLMILFKKICTIEMVVACFCID